VCIHANLTSTSTVSEEESTIKVTPRKDIKDGVIRPNGTIKLKRPFQKSINKPGNWRDGSVIDGGWPLFFFVG
jgi:SAGA-associated factor 73